MDDPTTIRIRNNQRRSRAKRKQYVRELEERLLRLQQEGVRATQEVQMAGRKVAEENKRLRALLEIRGVTETEIDEYLLDSEQDSQGPRMTVPCNVPVFSSISPFEMQMMKGTVNVEENSSSCTDSMEGHSHSATPNGHIICASQMTTAIDCDSPGIMADLGYVPETRPCQETTSGMDNELTSLKGLSDASRINNSNRENEITSCEAAARIIASFRGYRDIGDAKKELGCTSINCTVKNMTLFEILDR